LLKWPITAATMMIAPTVGWPIGDRGPLEQVVSLHLIVVCVEVVERIVEIHTRDSGHR
jgi:hypothetical protein